MKTYYLRITQKAPSMSEDKMEILAASYADAVRQCHDKWRELGRHVSLHDLEYDVYCWHRVDSLGNAVDKNSNSGVPAHIRLTR